MSENTLINHEETETDSKAVLNVASVDQQLVKELHQPFIQKFKTKKYICSFYTGKFKKFRFSDAKISLNFKHQQVQSHKHQVYQSEYCQKTYWIFFQKRSCESVASSYRFQYLAV